MDSNSQSWVANMTIENSDIHDNNNNNGVIQFLNANLNLKELSVIIFESVDIYNNTDLVQIVEDSSFDNDCLLVIRYNHFYFRNVIFYENVGAVLYHSYPNKPSYDIIFQF